MSKRGPQGPNSRSVLERLEQRLVRNPSSGCLEWQGATDDKGYGRMWDPETRKVDRAHRIAWRLKKGPIPEGLSVLHDCDNPPCCDETHLFLGTLADNGADMARKGRTAGPKKTHCPRGHVYDASNTRRRRRGKYLLRDCATCHRERTRLARARRKSLTPPPKETRP